MSFEPKQLCPSCGEDDNLQVVIFAFNAAIGSWGEDTFRTVAHAYLERK